MHSVLATYAIKSPDVWRAARAIAIGQSIGNPDWRTPYDCNLGDYTAKVVSVIDGEVAVVTVAYPLVLFSKSVHVNHLMSVLMGGQMDLGKLVTSCRLIDVELSALSLPGPYFGVSGIRQLVGVKERPLVGGIVKPKVGLTPSQEAEVCAEMAEGGVDFIKEDEILADVPYASVFKRVSAVMRALAKVGRKVIFAPCVSGDNPRMMRDALHAGANAVHMNVWGGFGQYLEARRKGIGVPIFFQRSGLQVWTDGPFSVSDKVVYGIVNAIGCDIAHVGMVGGYLDDDKHEVSLRIARMANTLPSFSCGANPNSVAPIVENFGTDVMITSGGYIHSYEGGTREGVRRMREAVEGVTILR